MSRQMMKYCKINGHPLLLYVDSSEFMLEIREDHSLHAPGSSLQILPPFRDPEVRRRICAHGPKNLWPARFDRNVTHEKQP